MFITILLVFGVCTLTNGYTGIIVRHSQSKYVPKCPYRYSQLWTGYSYGGNAPVDGSGDGQDLSSPGSCLKYFYSNAAAKCYGSSTCDHYQQRDFSAWLWGRDNKLPSRCAVCEGPYTHIVVHSQKSSYPSCPSGWRTAWSGYSYVQFSFHDTVGSAVDLGKSGSCLRFHESTPFLECYNSRCNRITGGDKSYWLSTRRYDERARYGSSRLGTISRCRVCYK